MKRYSLKFDHAEVNEKGDLVHTRDCMTCHVRISGNSDLKTLTDADVPIMACTSCHNHATDLKTEMDKRADSVEKKQPVFNCAYCHTSAVGAFYSPAESREAVRFIDLRRAGQEERGKPPFRTCEC